MDFPLARLQFSGFYLLSCHMSFQGSLLTLWHFHLSPDSSVWQHATCQEFPPQLVPAEQQRSGKLCCCIHSLYIKYLWAAVKKKKKKDKTKASSKFGIPSARSRAGSCGIITDLSVSLPCSMTGKRSMPSICLSLGGCTPARERLVLNRSITLPSWWLTCNTTINTNTFAKSPSGKSIWRQVPSKAPWKPLPLHCCSHQQTPLKTMKQRKQSLFLHFQGAFAFWFFFPFSSLSPHSCVSLFQACVVAGLNLI